MTFRLVDELIGYTQPGQVSATEFPLGGTIEPCLDPVFGGGEVMWVRAGGVIPVWAAVIVTPTWNAVTLRYDFVAVVVPNTANQSRAIGVAMQAMALNDYGWVLVSGNCPVSSNANVAAGAAVGVAAAGQLGASAAGKNVFGAVSIANGAVTVVTAMIAGKTLERQVRVASTAGLFVGGYVAGTGIPAATTITAIDEVNQLVSISNALTAAVAGNMTQTNNNGAIFYNTVAFNRPSLTNITV